MWAQIINTLMGIWLITSPGILSYEGSGADSSHITGPLIATIAMVACWEVTRGLRKLNLPLGLWLIAAPWVLGYETLLPILNDMICGALIMALAMVRGKINKSYGGGWKMLWQKQNV